MTKFQSFKIFGLIIVITFILIAGLFIYKQNYFFINKNDVKEVVDKTSISLDGKSFFLFERSDYEDETRIRVNSEETFVVSVTAEDSNFLKKTIEGKKVSPVITAKSKIFQMNIDAVGSVNYVFYSKGKYIYKNHDTIFNFNNIKIVEKSLLLILLIFLILMVLGIAFGKSDCCQNCERKDNCDNCGSID